MFQVLTDALELAPHLLPQLVAYTEHVHACAGTGAAVSPPDPSLQAAYIINATFAALGGFKEGIRPGMAVQLIGDGVHQTVAVVQSISEQRGMANIHFPSDDLCFGPGRTLEVPIARLLPPQKETLPLEHLGIRSQLFNAICSLLATPPPSITLVHSSVDATFPGLGTCRLFAELRSRAAMALAHHVQLPVFAELAKDPECVSKMMALAKQCSPGNVYKWMLMDEKIYVHNTTCTCMYTQTAHTHMQHTLYTHTHTHTHATHTVHTHTHAHTHATHTVHTHAHTLRTHMHTHTCTLCRTTFG